jgi:hypothetical protein
MSALVLVIQSLLTVFTGWEIGWACLVQDPPDEDVSAVSPSGTDRMIDARSMPASSGPAVQDACERCSHLVRLDRLGKKLFTDAGGERLLRYRPFVPRCTRTTPIPGPPWRNPGTRNLSWSRYRHEANETRILVGNISGIARTEC